MIWWPLLFIFSAIADDPAVERYCYNSPQEMQLNYSRAKAILVPSDQATEDENCLVIQMRPHRRELIQSYLRRLSPNVRIGFSSAEIRRNPCKLKVEKVKSLNSNQNSGTINAFGVTVNSEAQKVQSKNTMQIKTLQDFALSVGTEEIKGKCRYISPTRYEITLIVNTLPKPVLPATPPGTIVVVNSNQLPPPQETSSLQTTLQLTQGERTEIGGIVKDLKNKSGNASAEPSVSADNETSSSEEKVFLSLD